MRTTSFVITLITLSTLISSCSKDELRIGGETYSGSFIVTYTSSTQTGSTSIVFKNGNYTCVSDTNRIPAGGSGTYSIDNGKIIFHDTNIWTADFDWNLILNGEYDYTLDGNNLTISADKNNVGHYEYILEKK